MATLLFEIVKPTAKGVVLQLEATSPLGNVARIMVRQGTDYRMPKGKREPVFMLLVTKRIGGKWGKVEHRCSRHSMKEMVAELKKAAVAWGTMPKLKA